MIIKTGKIVCHSGALGWGAGKVLDVTAAMATIQFSDGISRKIAASHFSTLQPADSAFYSPPPDAAPAAKVRRASRTSTPKGKTTMAKAVQPEA
jgi:hypothetical protein